MKLIRISRDPFEVLHQTASSQAAMMTLAPGEQSRKASPT